MELHQLRYFITVCREGSFTRAAERLYIAQPSLSEQIRKLETELGTRLFERLGRRVALTSAGEAFRPHAERALFEVEEARNRVGEVLQLRRGRVAVGVLPSVGARLLPGVLAEYRSAHPGVQVVLREENVSAHFEDMVHAGELDLAVIRLPLRRPDLDARSLIREPLVLLVPPSHPLPSVGSVDPATLRDEPFVAMKATYGLRDLLLQVCRRAGFEPRIAVETAQLEIVRGLVEAGVGVTILPSLAAVGGARRVRLRDPGAVRELGVVWRRGWPLSPAAGAFLELLEQSAAQAGQRG
jgi:DNA-binding transcriptional LysR family regulator